MLCVADVRIPDAIPRYTIHQYLWGFYPQLPPDAPRPFLFKMQDGRCRLLSRIPPRTAYTMIGLEDGRSYAVDARIAPYRSRSQGFRYGGEGPKSVKEAILGNRERTDWLREGLERNGLALGHCLWFDRPPEQFRHAQGHAIRVFSARLAAMVTVIDSAKAIHLLETGVGRSRAFGCGLLYIPELMEVARAAA